MPGAKFTTLSSSPLGGPLGGRVILIAVLYMPGCKFKGLVASLKVCTVKPEQSGVGGVEMVWFGTPACVVPGDSEPEPVIVPLAHKTLPLFSDTCELFTTLALVQTLPPVMLMFELPEKVIPIPDVPVAKTALPEDRPGPTPPLPRA